MFILPMHRFGCVDDNVAHQTARRSNAKDAHLNAEGSVLALRLSYEQLRVLGCWRYWRQHTVTG